MDKLKQFIKKPVGLLITLFIVLLVFFVLIVKLLGGNDVANNAKNMQSQKDEQIQGNVRYTTQETLNTVSGEADNLTQNVAQLKNQLTQVKKKNAQERKENQMLFKKEIAALKKQNNDLKDSITKTLSNLKVQASKQNKKRVDEYRIGKDYKNQSSKNSDFIWVNDSAMTPEMKTALKKDRFSVPSNASNNRSSDSLLHPNRGLGIAGDRRNTNLRSNRAKVIKMYTIPQNTWLTGVIAEQPLIGIVPVNGEVINPRTLSFAVQAKNLAANNWHLPAVLKGIQGDAVCQGFFAIKRPAVTCNVTSLTFIFQDGRINTVNAKQNKKLGVITDLYGNPQISGNLHSNLGYFLAGTTLFSGAQGYGNALSAAQVNTQSGAGAVPSITTIIHNANTYAAGQGLSAAAQAANQWWVDRMKSTFDYVEVPNWNPRTHQLLQLNVKVTQSIALDYNHKDRKVIYAHDNSQSTNNSLD